MAETLTPISNINSTTINALVALVNAIVGVIGGDSVTANGAANGALTVGNGYVSGIFGGSVLVAGAIRGGNVQSGATLPVSSNLFVSNGILTVGNSTVNASMNSINLTVPTVNVVNGSIAYFPQSNITFANTSLADVELSNLAAGAVILDTFPLATYRTAEYLVQAKDNAANNVQAVKILVTHDNVNPYYTEYALLQPNNQVAGLVFTTNATTMILTATTTSTNATIRSLRTTLTA